MGVCAPSIPGASAPAPVTSVGKGSAASKAGTVAKQTRVARAQNL